MEATTTTYTFIFHGFWFFLAVMYTCDTWLYSKGFNNWFHSFKEPEEKELRQAIIDKAKKDAL